MTAGDDATAPAPAGAVSTSGADAARVLTLADVGLEAPAALLARHGLALVQVPDGQPPVNKSTQVMDFEATNTEGASFHEFTLNTDNH